jgi:hypothetical protein
LYFRFDLTFLTILGKQTIAMQAWLVKLSLAHLVVVTNAWSPTSVNRRSRRRVGVVPDSISRRDSFTILSRPVFVAVSGARMAKAEETNPSGSSLLSSAELSTSGLSKPAAATNLIPFKDPLGLFELGVPKGWFKVRPTVKGDLPNAEGKGRRGARIFSAGDVSDP